MTSKPAGAPGRTLRTRDAVGLIVGLVIGAGIFRLSAMVAANSATDSVFLAYWVAGGLVSLIGALCYCELAATYPDAGGDYYFLQRAFGARLAFLFAWARIAVITTGSIAVLAFTFGDYMSNLLRLGAQSSAVWAVIAVIGVTAINLSGIRRTASIQNLLTGCEVLGIVAVIITGLVLLPPAEVVAAARPVAPNDGWLTGAPVAMLFVLFTFGGWSDGAYISAELKGQRSIVAAMVVSLLIVTLLYVAINAAYLRALGLAGVAASATVAADVLARQFGASGTVLISLIVAVSALTSINATIVVGARSTYALGRDWPVFARLGRWHVASGAPRGALVVQGAVALLLVAAGSVTDKVQTMVNYTMPVFWFFFMMVGVGLMRLRARDPQTHRVFRVPLYPLAPLVFIATCAWLLYSSLAFVGGGAWVGIYVLAAGVVLLLLQARLPARDAVLKHFGNGAKGDLHRP